MKGTFIISLDFEIHWGVCDRLKVEDYETNLKNVGIVIERLLTMADEYNINLTFATVGFLFANNKIELVKSQPRSLPAYSISSLNPYPLFSDVGENEKDDPFHYAISQIHKIKGKPNHEIGTHTFSHYYCIENGQNADHFRQDLEAAVDIALKNDIEIKSIVFPRNQINNEYLKICSKLGLTSYRGVEKSKIYRPVSFSSKILLSRTVRLLDSYLNFTGPNTYNVVFLKTESGLLNLPSSRFLRPYNKRFRALEGLKIRRIKRAMLYAAKNNELFHLWWHPHNFGSDIDENFNNLKLIFDFYKELNMTYEFSSVTMTELTNSIIE